jgi:hypothetical protein
MLVMGFPRLVLHRPTEAATTSLLCDQPVEPALPGTATLLARDPNFLEPANLARSLGMARTVQLRE